MKGYKTEIIVGVLGQWASGKSTAAKTLIDYLGGKEEAIFITDRELLAMQAVNHILELDDSKVTHRIDERGERIEGELSTVYLRQGENLETVDLNTILFDLRDEVYDNVPINSYSWIDETRLELGRQICERSAEGKPIVIEAGFGTNTEPRGEKPFSHSMSDLFLRLEEAGVYPKLVKWIIIEASYKRRSKRNQKRKDTVPAKEFDRFAADGGDLSPEEEKERVGQGTKLTRVANNHDDFERFKGDIIGAFEELFKTV
jgi:hypothetical protein